MIGLLDCPTPPPVRGKIRQVRFDNRGRSVVASASQRRQRRIYSKPVHEEVLMGALRMRAVVEEVTPIRDLFFLPLIEE